MSRLLLSVFTLLITSISISAADIVYSEGWLKADALEKAAAAKKSQPRVTADSRRKLPYTVRYPNGKSSLCLSREFHVDGSHTDWYAKGRARYYNADGAFTGHKRGECADCGSTLQTSSTVRGQNIPQNSQAKTNVPYRGRMMNGVYQSCPTGTCFKKNSTENH